MGAEVPGLTPRYLRLASNAFLLLLALLSCVALARALGGARLRFAIESALRSATQLWVLSAALLIGAMTWMFEALAERSAESARMRKLVGRLSPSFAEPAAGERDAAKAKACEITALLADIRDFTSFAEALKPEELLAFLNDYFSRMVEIVARNGGVVDKFMGDGLLAIFGAPKPVADHAMRAVACALEMHFCLGRFNAERARTGLAPVRFGVALNTGTVLAGLVGSAERFEYTVVGDTINTVSRLEGLNTKLGTELLATEATYRLTQSLFAYRAIGRVCVRGRRSPVNVYQLLGPATPTPDGAGGNDSLAKPSPRPSEPA
ncbi:MAG: adenylate/guanylate cyclase domain-containing protein [Elusimicrobia bacterium]|nr:adenylate/guanylate cyclase domain-containing protein [Elusimicrobiota bacterium]